MLLTINNIDSKCHNYYKETEMQQDLFDWLFELHFMRMVFNSLGADTHTHKQTYIPIVDKCNFVKPGMPAFSRRAPGLKRKPGATFSMR